MVEDNVCTQSIFKALGFLVDDTKYRIVKVMLIHFSHRVSAAIRATSRRCSPVSF